MASGPVLRRADDTGGEGWGDTSPLLPPCPTAPHTCPTAPHTCPTAPHGISPARARLTVAVLCYINLLNYMDRFTVASVLPDVEDFFGIGDSSSGLLQTVFILSYMVLAPVFGYLGDRHSRKRLLCLGIALWSAVTLGSSFVPREVTPALGALALALLVTVVTDAPRGRWRGPRPRPPPQLLGYRPAGVGHQPQPRAVHAGFHGGGLCHRGAGPVGSGLPGPVPRGQWGRGPLRGGGSAATGTRGDMPGVRGADLRLGGAGGGGGGRALAPPEPALAPRRPPALRRGAAGGRPLPAAGAAAGAPLPARRLRFHLRGGDAAVAELGHRGRHLTVRRGPDPAGDGRGAADRHLPPAGGRGEPLPGRTAERLAAPLPPSWPGAAGGPGPGAAALPLRGGAGGGAFLGTARALPRDRRRAQREARGLPEDADGADEAEGSGDLVVPRGGRSMKVPVAQVLA
ncbi:unnamed protein product [Bubo scandiacus]